ncbi:hypothetical protein F4810DRAFT_665406 [Camillea tinctor]|nr:hypothetical protein F4810DRAFT_665406 [Camillea tinctor]
MTPPLHLTPEETYFLALVPSSSLPRNRPSSTDPLPRQDKTNSPILLLRSYCDEMEGLGEKKKYDGYDKKPALVECREKKDGGEYRGEKDAYEAGEVIYPTLCAKENHASAPLLPYDEAMARYILGHGSQGEGLGTEEHGGGKHEAVGKGREGGEGERRDGGGGGKIARRGRTGRKMGGIGVCALSLFAVAVGVVAVVVMGAMSDDVAGMVV